MKKINKKLKLFLVLLIGMFLVNGVFAVWYVSFVAEAEYSITSDELGFSIVSTLFDEVINTNASAYNNTQRIEFNFTASGNVPANIEITHLVDDDTEDGCLDYEDDCIVGYSFSSLNKGMLGVLWEGSNNKTFSTDTYYIDVELYCVQYSCPQWVYETISVDLY